MRATCRIFCFVSILGVALLLEGLAEARPTYYIDEGTDFTDNGCPNITDVNTITASLASALNTDGWTGSRFTNSSAWPQDFRESCNSAYGTGGLDYLYADYKNLAVYAGHGSSNGTIYFGYPHNGVCNNVIQTNSRLGAMGGSQAAVGMWLECEVLSDLIDVVNTQNLWQDLGWGNDISIGDNEPRDVYLATSSMTNRDAWFNTMAGGGRSPTVVSYSSSSTSDCWNNQYSAALRRSILTTPRWTGPMCLQGEPTFYYCFEFVSP